MSLGFFKKLSNNSQFPEKSKYGMARARDCGMTYKYKGTRLTDIMKRRRKRDD